MMHKQYIAARKRILRSMSEKSSEDAFKALEKMGIHVHLETRVTSFDGSTIETNSDLEIKANTVIWAAGIKAVNFEGLEKAVIERGGRYKVDAFNQLEGYEDVFVIGDTAISFEDPHFPDGHPQVAQTAIQMGKVLGKNLTRMQQGAEMRPFR